MDKTQNISDEELIRQLTAHGVAVDKKAFPKKREIYIKQLNHLIARSKPPTSPGKKGASSHSSGEGSSSVYEPRKTRSRSGLRGQGDVLPPPPEPPVPESFLSGRMPSTIHAPSPSFLESLPNSSQQNFDSSLGGGGNYQFATPGSPGSASSSPTFTRYSPAPRAKQRKVPQQPPQGQEISLKEHFQGLFDRFNAQFSNYMVTILVIFAGVLLFNNFMPKPREKIGPNRQIVNEQIVASENDRLLICDNKKFEQPCFPEGVVRNCLPILPSIRTVLDADFVKKRCYGNETDESYQGLPIASAISEAKSEMTARTTVDPDEDALLTLIHANPHWRIQLVDRSGEIAESIDSAVNFRTKAVKLPFMCRTKVMAMNAVSFALKLLVAFFGVVVVCGLVMASFWTLRAKIAYRRRFKAQVHEFADQIVDAVRKQHEAYLDHLNQTQQSPSSYIPARPIKDFVVIRHLADTLIPLDQRAALLPAWNAAVELIRASDSRIRTIVRTVDGEHVNVWEWIAEKIQGGPQTSARSPNSTMKPSTSQQSRTPSPTRRGRPSLQGAKGSVDRSPSGGRGGRPPLPMGSPPGLTQCLKIRGILRNTNPANPKTLDEAQARIREAAMALGSCGSRGILEVHVKALNDGSLAIYARCSDETASGRLTSALRKTYANVVVHYLNVDKFNQQFPQ